ncbi:MAG: hypothetical protein ACW964_04100 [Candidatus Hodarchaeales archaeon]|jgi:hypothetical protein
MKTVNNVKFERIVIGLTAIVLGLTIAMISILGPLILDIIEYASSESAITQGKGQDLVNLILITPLCLIGGIMYLLKKENAKYFLIMVPLYSMLYTGLAYGLFPEWSHPTYTGNSEQYSLLFYIVIISSLILLISSLSMFSPDDAPEFNRRNLKIYIIMVAIFLGLFAFMWIGEYLEVITTGDTSTGSYSAAPTIFWVVRYFDLGLTIPLGFIGLYLLWTRTKQAYSLMLLFFGFFVTIGTAVVGMAIIMILENDPSVQLGVLIIFPVLMILSWSGYFYLIKDKIPLFNA